MLAPARRPCGVHGTRRADRARLVGGHRGQPMNPKTYSTKRDELDARWYVIDAQDKILGRVATEIATILRGKHNPTFTPHLNCSAYVVVVKAMTVAITGQR